MVWAKTLATDEPPAGFSIPASCISCSTATYKYQKLRVLMQLLCITYPDIHDSADEHLPHDNEKEARVSFN